MFHANATNSGNKATSLSSTSGTIAVSAISTLEVPRDNAELQQATHLSYQAKES